MSIIIQPTPNPNALKFILDQAVKQEGKSSYKSPQECEHNPLARALFGLQGVDQVHFFDNVITVSKFGYEEWAPLEEAVIALIKERLPGHDPNYHDPNPEEERRAQLSPELRQIEEILDRTVRPGLQGDGGDLECLTYEDHILVIKYEGACGSCPSSTTGTLQAIQGILREQFDPEIAVYTAPSF